MICAAVIILCVIVGYIAASNGEWGPFAICVVIAIGALLMSNNDLLRAENNFIDYWAHPEIRRKRKQKEKRETEEEKHARWRKERYEREHGGVVRVDGVETAGEIEKAGDVTGTCRVCGGIMREKSRIRYGSGTVYATCKCEKCGHEAPVKVV